MRNVQLILSVVMLLFTAVSTSAQEKSLAPDYKIRVKVNGVKDSTVYLANYFGNKLYYNDTAKADASGYFEFDGKPFEEGGKYAVVVPGPKYFDIIVSDEDIYLETNVNDFVGGMKVHESAENKLFFDYLHYIEDKKQERMPLDEVLQSESSTEKEKKAATDKLKELNEEVVNYQKSLVQQNPDLLAAKMVNMTMEIDVPEAPEGVDDPNWKYRYYLDHYWDNVDLKDPRIVRDQFIQKKLDHFANKALPQIPDTIAQEAIKVIEQTRGNDELFKYFVHFFTSNAEKSKVMCMDKVFVAMVDKYYRAGEASWMDEEALKRILEAAEDKRYTLCGEVVPNIILPDTTLTNWEALYDIDSEYTLIVIWESNCGHCKKEMPKLKQVYEKWKPEGVEVFAIGNDFETEEWIEFVREKELDWINVSDNPAINDSDSALVLIRNGITTLPSLNFRKTFDVFSTPKIYLLDNEKKIVAKQLSSQQIDELLIKLTGKEPDYEIIWDEPKGKKNKGKAAKDADETDEGEEMH